MLIDSHCHLNYPGLKEDLPTVIQNAKEAQIKYLVTISTNLDQSQDIQTILDTYDMVYGTTGQHPCEAFDAADLYDQIIQTADHPKIVGIGETGLDYFHKTIAPDIQKRSLDAHIQAANDLDLPLIIHTREAEEDTLAFIKKAKRPGILHCFTSSYDMAVKALDMGFYISFSGILTYTSAEDLRQTARKIPKDRVLIETDAPYLIPKAMRGTSKVNQPAFVQSTCQVLAEIWEWSFDETAQQTTTNCLHVLHKLPKPSIF